MTPDAPPPPAAGLCSTCQHTREIVSGKGSRFYYCGRSETDPAYVKYPNLPVLACGGYQFNTVKKSNMESGQ